MLVHSQVGLLVGPEAVVHLPLQVNGQVRNAQDGASQVHQAVSQVGALLQYTQHSGESIGVILQSTQLSGESGWGIMKSTQLSGESGWAS